MNYRLSLLTGSLLLTQCIREDSHNASAGLSFPGNKPNILFYITDDQSWLNTSISGENQVQTPGFDRVARNGVLFRNAFCPSPSCAPCRASILTGRYPWQLEEGALLFGGIPRKYPLFTHLLESAGYESAMCYKGYWPGNMKDSVYHTNPFGKAYLVAPVDPYPEGLANCDYAASFEKFLGERDTARPFFFWMGVSEPHRVYAKGIGLSSGMSIDSVKVPAFLPDTPEIRSDLLDYYYEINHQDRHLLRMLELLEKRGELDNTIIIVTSDNGMPFPHAKANLYEYGTHIPLAICWGKAIKSGRTVDDIVNLTDIGPTLLEIAGIPLPKEMSGKSLGKVLLSPLSGMIDKNNDFTVTAFERHTWSRKGGLGYPVRALRTREWLLIRNFEPDRWPAGDPPPFVPLYNSDYGDVDGSPTKQFVIENQYNPDISDYFDLAFSKRPEYELYNLSSDPANIYNLAYQEQHSKKLKELEGQLIAFLSKTGDPRAFGEALWDKMPFFILNEKPSPVTKDSHPHLY